ncbi:MAG: radical SAM protein [Clostridiales bacterium]|nr:radical SAM protein [Clostridiales bacterium]
MPNTPLQNKCFDALWDKARIVSGGIRVSDSAAANSGAGVTAKEAAGRDRRGDEALLPMMFSIPLGFTMFLRQNPKSDYALEYEDGIFFVTKGGALLWEGITFPKRPKFYDGETSDGKKFRDIGMILTDKCIEVWYSNECAFKERDEECMFCDINKRGPGDTFLKQSSHIAELTKAAFDEGIADRIDFTGGVIAERREIEYYTDAIEAIQDALGCTDINSSACIAAPRDFGNIGRLKEAGFSNVTLNMEIWDENIFRTVCPGKERTVGHARWIEAEKYAARVFGFGHVRCNFVTGIEPKFKTLEGIEYLASVGVYANPNSFGPRAGTPFEGVRPPTLEWYYDLSFKAAEIQMRCGFTYELVRSCHPETTQIIFDVYRIREELLPVFGHQEKFELR